ncbi:hypothetical protein [Desulfocicer vacuolatum]|uniref:hypothetical protein n=1 Tax=Desulfocicer vacuolatum TaxID=2298 RepID=UPI00111C9371|nr:hypothetical protein [Desulfocicer vacuolatum]
MNLKTGVLYCVIIESLGIGAVAGVVRISKKKITDRCHLKTPVYSIQGGEIEGETTFLPNKKRVQHLS